MFTDGQQDQLLESWAAPREKRRKLDKANEPWGFHSSFLQQHSALGNAGFQTQLRTLSETGFQPTGIDFDGCTDSDGTDDSMMDGIVIERTEHHDSAATTSLRFGSCGQDAGTDDWMFGLTRAASFAPEPAALGHSTLSSPRGSVQLPLAAVQVQQPAYNQLSDDMDMDCGPRINQLQTGLVPAVPVQGQDLNARLDQLFQDFKAEMTHRRQPEPYLQVRCFSEPKADGTYMHVQLTPAPQSVQPSVSFANMLPPLPGLP